MARGRTRRTVNQETEGDSERIPPQVVAGNQGGAGDSGNGATPGRAPDERDVSIGKLTELVTLQSQQIISLLNKDQGIVRAGSSNQESSERFMKMHPPNFSGHSSDPAIAEEWIRKMEDLFAFSKTEEEDKVSCAVFMLVNDARFWWDSVKVSQDMATLTWAKFKEMFNEKYFGFSVQSNKLREFMQLKQTGSVAEYVNKFEALSRFASHLVSKDEHKVQHFIDGLKDEIFRGVKTAGSRGVSYSQVVMNAFDVEEGELRCNRLVSNQKRFFREVFPQQGKGWPPKGVKRPSDNQAGSQDRGKKVQTTMTQVPPCPKCHKAHRGECMAGSGLCYICKGAGHMAKDCPKHNQRQQGVQPRLYSMVEQSNAEPSDTPRLFAMIDAEDSGTPAVIAGITFNIRIFMHDRICYFNY